MGDAAKIFPRVPSTCAQNAILSLLIIWDCKAMGDTAKSLLAFLLPVRKLQFSVY